MWLKRFAGAGKRLLWATIVFHLLMLAFFLGRLTGGKSGSGDGVDSSHAEARAEVWTCSMHPQIRMPKAGKCPICFMDLIPVEQGGGDGNDHGAMLVLSAGARERAGIVTAPAVRRGVSAQVRMSGKIALDETRVEAITARVGGRIDRLYVDYTGVKVRRGDHLAELYSPELVSLQQELISAAAAVTSLPAEASDLVREGVQRTYGAARDKLRLLGFSDQELEAVLSRSAPSDHMTIRATQEGVVLEKMVSAGSYVEMGMPMFRIADLSRVWAQFDAYESDLAWLRLGQKVAFTVEAFPGQEFGGTVSFIDPVVDPMMRTVKVRVIADNKGGQLKPEMFVRGQVDAEISKSGRVLNRSLRGKWVSPMHPQVVKNGPGTCDICGMPLVPAESLGYVTSGFEDVNPLVIPATAPLVTGTRAVVYVETANEAGDPVYEGREVVLGARVGDLYVVRSGLVEGELVVVNGAFRIDSELQIRARPSMMNPARPAGQHTGPPAAAAAALTDAAAGAPPEFTTKLQPLFAAYFDLTKVLTEDSLLAAVKAMTRLEKTRRAVVAGSGPAYAVWRRADTALAAALEHRAHAASLADARTLFEKVSTHLIAVERAYGHDRGTRHLAFCPMAFDNKGAYWLQTVREIANPYFGPTMLKCGEVKESYAAR